MQNDNDDDGRTERMCAVSTSVRLITIVGIDWECSRESICVYCVATRDAMDLQLERTQPTHLSKYVVAAWCPAPMYWHEIAFRTSQTLKRDATNRLIQMASICVGAADCGWFLIRLGCIHNRSLQIGCGVCNVHGQEKWTATAQRQQQNVFRNTTKRKRRKNRKHNRIAQRVASLSHERGNM